MMPPTNMPQNSHHGFGAAWDNDARRSQPTAGVWPGDEWGDERLWSRATILA